MHVMMVLIKMTFGALLLLISVFLPVIVVEKRALETRKIPVRWPFGALNSLNAEGE